MFRPWASGLGLAGLQLLLSVLALLSLLTRRLDLGHQSLSQQAVTRLVALSGSNGVVDQTEAGALTATELGLETEQEDGGLIVDLVHLSNKLLQLSLGHISTSRVDDIQDKLSAGEQRVRHKVASSEGHAVAHPR